MKKLEGFIWSEIAKNTHFIGVPIDQGALFKAIGCPYWTQSTLPLISGLWPDNTTDMHELPFSSSFYPWFRYFDFIYMIKYVEGNDTHIYGYSSNITEFQNRDLFPQNR